MSKHMLNILKPSLQHELSTENPVSESLQVWESQSLFEQNQIRWL